MNPVPSDKARLTEIGRRAMQARGLRPTFDPAALAEAQAAERTVPSNGQAVRDLRRLLWCSIDNDDTRDLDQLTAGEPLGDGATRLLIAIADVDVLVDPGSAMDEHARANTTSVYTTAAVFPMLPETLSTDLTSLGEGEERRAMVVDLTVRADGGLAAFDIYPALVFNHAKLAYNSIAAWLGDSAPPPLALARVPGLPEALRLQEDAARALRARRHERGALTLETTGVRPVFDGDALVDLRPDEKNRAKTLIEELMITANSAVAEYLERAGFPSLRRVLRAPDRWRRIVELARAAGETLPATPDAPALERFLNHRRSTDPDTFPELSLAVVKLLGGGEYEVGLPSAIAHDHFGLAVRDYAHSTAPNRRYPDLVTQRMLKAAIAGRPSPYGLEELTLLAGHCTRQEDNAAKVERQVRKSAAALLLAPRVGERFEAIVTGASPKGTWVRLLQPIVDGKLVAGFEGLDVGDVLPVKLQQVDVDRGLIDFVR